MYTDYTDDDNSENYYDDSQNGNNFDKDKIKKIAIIVGVFVITLILVIVLVKSCSRKDDKTANVSESNHTPSVIISRETLALEVGEQQELEVNILMTDNPNLTVGWYSEDSAIATVDSEGGLKASITAVKEGTTTIVVSYRENGKVYSNRCVVTVTSAPVKLESIEIIQESITLAISKEVLLEIKTLPADAKATNLVFESDDPDVASVSENGTIKGVNLGTTTVRVKTEDGSLSDSVTVRVTENGTTIINPVSLQVNNLTNGLKVGGTAQINYQILPENATNKTVTWTSTNTNIATVNSEGVVTGIAPGTCVIVGSTSNNVSGQIQVTVEANVVPVDYITIADDQIINMTVNGTKVLKYTIFPENATNKNVLYTTSDKNVVFVNSLGIMAARNPGTAIITITTEDGKKTASATVNVTGTSANATTQSNPSGNSTSSSGGSGSSSSVSSSSSSGGSSSSNSDVSCTDSLITYITHNGESKGAKISSISFSNAKAFSNMTAIPTITFTDIADCLDQNRIYYYVYYGTTANNISSSTSANGNVRKNSTIQLKNGNGYYKINIKAYLKNSTGVDFNKTYYAIVQNTSSDTTKPIVSSLSYSNKTSTSIRITAVINETGSGIKNILYCFTSLSSCTPYSTFYSYTDYKKSQRFTASKDITNSGLSTYKNICLNAIDASGNKSVTTCKGIK